LPKIYRQKPTRQEVNGLRKITHLKGTPQKIAQAILKNNNRIFAEPETAFAV
jgi:hypothetical protein